ncbi:MAG: prepilin-type N-terminal cleavage/methylation domain-containing protein [Acidobacteria bacterium]|nr:prepilin-type N-terminal cleavage/methylation domain-containing protein [Acidobacteriota bacterium]
MVKRTHNSERETGFTLLELMVVMIIIATLAALAVPAYRAQVRKAQEAVLREDLLVMRQAIDQFTVDKQKAPQSLDDLVQAGYLKAIPKDPFTQRSDTWVVQQSSDYSSVDQTDTGTIDVHSGSQEISSDNVPYTQW